MHERESPLAYSKLRIVRTVYQQQRAFLFNTRLASYYRRLRMYYRRWWRSSGVIPALGQVFSGDQYAAWVKEESQALRFYRDPQLRFTNFVNQPTIGVFVDVHSPLPSWFEDCLASVQSQWYPHWEVWLCLTEKEVSESSFITRWQARDPRIKIAVAAADQSLVSALNQALVRTSSEFIGLLGQHDTLAPHAFYAMAKRVQRQEVDYCYSDEDTIDENGRRSQPFCKPDWSPDLNQSSLYACHLGLYRRQLIDEVGGFRSEYAASVGYDLLPHCTERSDRIVHVPQVLYHKRLQINEFPLLRGEGQGERESAAVHAAAKQALREFFTRGGEPTTVKDGPAPCTFHVRRPIHNQPLISIVIATRDQLDLLRSCIDSIEKRTAYRNYEILLIDNGSREPQTLAYFADSSHRVLRYDEPFNFARLNNKAVPEAKGAYILLLNNDVEVIAEEWLTAMLEHGQRQEVGAVGAQLLYPDGAIQHAGVIVGLGGVAAHAHKYLPAAELGYFSLPRLTCNYSAVTAACMLVRKSVYEDLGGLDERLGIEFNDVDFCLRVRARGYVIVYTPHARLYHHESRSRWRQPPPTEEKRYMVERWNTVISSDPQYNPHLTLNREDYSFDRARARALLKEFCPSRR